MYNDYRGATEIACTNMKHDSITFFFLNFLKSILLFADSSVLYCMDLGNGSDIEADNPDSTCITEANCQLITYIYQVPSYLCPLILKLKGDFMEFIASDEHFGCRSVSCHCQLMCQQMKI